MGSFDEAEIPARRLLWFSVGIGFLGEAGFCFSFFVLGVDSLAFPGKVELVPSRIWREVAMIWVCALSK